MWSSKPATVRGGESSRCSTGKVSTCHLVAAGGNGHDQVVRGSLVGRRPGMRVSTAHMPFLTEWITPLFRPTGRGRGS
jgi:hypothetical protein